MVEPSDGGDPQCSHCGLRFSPTHNIGTWECRRHTMPLDPLTYRYPCCGTALEPKRRLSLFALDSWPDFLGCHRCDHALVPGAQLLVLVPNYRITARSRATRITSYADVQRLGEPALLRQLPDDDTFQHVMAGIRAQSCLDPELYRRGGGTILTSQNGAQCMAAIRQNVARLGQGHRPLITHSGQQMTLSAFLTWTPDENGWARLAEFMDLVSKETMDSAGGELREACRASLAPLISGAVVLVLVRRVDPELDLRTVLNARANMRNWA
jgi:hypothetical protein